MPYQPPPSPQLTDAGKTCPVCHACSVCGERACAICLANDCGHAADDKCQTCAMETCADCRAERADDIAGEIGEGMWRGEL